MKKIIVSNIMETSYDDNSNWIEYIIGDRYGYELDYVAKEGMEEITEKAYNTNEKLNHLAIDKPLIDVCSKFLKEIIEECRQSENEMWFIEDGDLQEHYNIEEEEQEKFIEKIIDEAEKLGVGEYITCYEDGALITVYGGIITKFLF